MKEKETASKRERARRHLEQRLQAPALFTVVSTSILDRGRIFAPTAEPGVRDTWDAPDVVPYVCTTQVCGRLGQAHAALLESALFRRIKSEDRQTADGGKSIVVPMAAVLKDLSTVAFYSAESCRRLLDDLCMTRIRLSAFGKTWGHPWNGKAAPSCLEGTLLSKWSRKEKPQSRQGACGNEILLRLVLSPMYVSLIRHDKAPTGRLERLGIVHLRHGLSRAVARWLLSHDAGSQPHGGWFMETPAEAVCGELSPAQMAKARAALRSEAEDAWRLCGIRMFCGGSSKPNRFELLKRS